MRRFFVGAGCVALVAFAIGACGKIDPDDSTTSSSDDAGFTRDARAFDYDGDTTFSDAGPFPPLLIPDASLPDGGPAPTPPCLDAGLACPLPPSFCIDERWLRYYTSGSCDTEAGVCDFVANELNCAALGNVCYNDGCNMQLIR